MTDSPSPRRDPVPLHRGDGARHRARMAGPVGGGGHFPGAQPGRAVGRAREGRRSRHEAASSSTCSRTRAGRVSTSATRWATSARTCMRATTGCSARTSCTAWATTRSGCPPSSTPCRPASTRARRPRTTWSSCAASCGGWAWASTSGAATRPSTRTTSAGRSGSSCRSTTPGTTRTRCGRTGHEARLGRSRRWPRRMRRVGGRCRTSLSGRSWADLSEAEQEALLAEERLAYTSEAPVNWSPGLGTVLSNEEVTNEGLSERGNFPVFRRSLSQWMMRITAYADRLADDLDRVDWPEKVKIMQRNWIGRSPAARGSHFPVASASEGPGRGHRGLHDPSGHRVRRDVHGGGARASAARRDRTRRWLAGRDQAGVDRRRRRRRDRAVDAYRQSTSRKSEVERQMESRVQDRRLRRRHAIESRSRRRAFRCSSPTTC